MADSRPILCLDFDGVAHSYTSGWHGAAVADDPPVPGLFEFLAEATEQFEVVVHSSRSAQPGGIRAMVEWFDREWAKWCDAGGSWNIEGKIHFPFEKPAASVILDDRALTFNGKWPSVKDLAEFSPWTHGGRPPSALPPEGDGPCTVTIIFDNSDDALSQSRWSEFTGAAVKAAREVGIVSFLGAPSSLGAIQSCVLVVDTDRPQELKQRMVTVSSAFTPKPFVWLKSAAVWVTPTPFARQDAEVQAPVN